MIIHKLMSVSLVYKLKAVFAISYGIEITKVIVRCAHTKTVR